MTPCTMSEENLQTGCKKREKVYFGLWNRAERRKENYCRDNWDKNDEKRWGRKQEAFVGKKWMCWRKKKSWTETACLTCWHSNHHCSLNSNWHLKFTLFTSCLAFGVWKTALPVEKHEHYVRNDIHASVCLFKSLMNQRQNPPVTIRQTCGTFLSLQSAEGTTGNACYETTIWL